MNAGVMQITREYLPRHVVGDPAVEMGFSAHLGQRNDAVGSRTTTGHAFVRIFQLSHQAVLTLLVDERHHTLFDVQLGEPLRGRVIFDIDQRIGRVGRAFQIDDRDLATVGPGLRLGLLEHHRDTCERLVHAGNLPGQIRRVLDGGLLGRHPVARAGMLWA